MTDRMKWQLGRLFNSLCRIILAAVIIKAIWNHFLSGYCMPINFWWAVLLYAAIRSLSGSNFELDEILLTHFDKDGKRKEG